MEDYRPGIANKATWIRIEGPNVMAKGVQTMTSRRFVWACVIGAFCCAVLVGCGGEEGLRINMVGVYGGNMAGDGTGPVRFYIGPNGQLTGNFRVSPICNGPVHVTGTVTPYIGWSNDNATFQGAGCGITFQGTGKVEPIAPGSTTYVGSGTWTGSDGTSGTWSATWVARTGAIGV